MADYDREEYWDEDDGPALLTDESAMEWAQENREELKATFDTDAYHESVLAAHLALFPEAEAELKKADQRLVEGEFAEAAFHASRALEGYVRGVYLGPLIHVMTAGIAAGLKTPTEIARRFVPNQVKDAAALLTLGLSVFYAEEAKINERRKVILGAFAPEGPWRLRNEVDHTLEKLDQARATEIVRHAHERLPSIASVPILIFQEREEAAKKRLANPRRSPFADFE